MNLKAKHFPIILLGGVVAAFIGFVASFALRPGIVPEVEEVVGLRGAGPIFGAVLGLAAAVIVLVIKDAHDPQTGPAKNFTRINGTGSALIGHADSREDGSYAVTEWFTLLWVPVFPVCRYRLIKHSDQSDLVVQRYTILEKHPPRARDVVKIYGLTVLALFCLVGVAVTIFR